MAAIFRLDGYENVHLKCREALENLQQEFNAYKRQTKKENTGEAQSESEKIEMNLELMTLRETVEEYKVLLMEEKQDKADKIKALEDVSADDFACVILLENPRIHRFLKHFSIYV